MKKDFYGTQIIPLTFKDGSQAVLGDVIRWSAWDNDDNTTWTFTGIYKSDHIVYLGGGIDFGMAIGKRIEIQEAIDESENHDISEQIGFVKVGKAQDVSAVISELNIA